MSRTIRCKNWVPERVTGKLQLINNECYPTWCGSFVRIPYTGDALTKRLAVWHADNKERNHNRPGKDFRQAEERIHRAECRTEIVRFAKNPDHEVMILSKKPLPYWD